MYCSKNNQGYEKIENSINIQHPQYQNSNEVPTEVNCHAHKKCCILIKTILFRFFLNFIQFYLVLSSALVLSKEFVEFIQNMRKRKQKIEIHINLLQKNRASGQKLTKTRNFRDNEFTYVVRRPRTMPNMINKMASNTRYRVHIIFVNRQKVLTYYDLTRFLMESFQFLTHYDLTRFFSKVFQI